MQHFLATALTVVLLATSAAAPELGDPASRLNVGEPVMAQLELMPTAPFGGFCAMCIPCDFDMYYAPPGGGENGYSNQGCQWGRGCIAPCMLVENTLTIDQMKDISDRVLSGAPDAVIDVIAQYESQVHLNAERGSLQFRSCNGDLVANLPLTDVQLTAVLAQS